MGEAEFVPTSAGTDLDLALTDGREMARRQSVMFSDTAPRVIDESSHAEVPTFGINFTNTCSLVESCQLSSNFLKMQRILAIHIKLCRHGIRGGLRQAVGHRRHASKKKFTITVAISFFSPFQFFLYTFN